jgi:hypothetical protein
MRISFSLAFVAFWAASSVMAAKPEPLPKTCSSVCPPGVTCPEYDGCYLQGRKTMAAEADRRCAASVDAARAEEKAKYEAKIAEMEASCNAKVSEEKSSCDAKLADKETSCNTKLAEKDASCNTKLSEKDTACNTRVTERDIACNDRVIKAATANLPELNVCRAQLAQCQTVPTKPPTCGTDKWGRNWYERKLDTTLVNCQKICNTDPRCLSFSGNKANAGDINCYLYDKETAEVPHNTWPNFVQYDKRCGPVPNRPSCGVFKRGLDWYDYKPGVELGSCQGVCRGDPRCYSFSSKWREPNPGDTGCYLYDRETVEIPYGSWPNFYQYDKRCETYKE